MKRFITASDVEFLSLTGQRTLRIDEEDIVTSVAQEMAAKLGITITQETSSPTHGGTPSTSPEFLEEPRGKLFASERLGDIVLKDGNIVWPGQGLFRGNIRISQGKISGIYHSSESAPGGSQEIDITGKYVLPGIIDPHVHLGIFNPFERDAERETKAGLWGGVTTVGCFLYDKESYLSKIESLSQKVRAHSLADIFFHLSIATPQHLEEIPRYVHEHGISSFKIYMSGVPGVIPDIDDGFMTRVYEKLAETRQKCTVCIHAENASLVRWATEEIMAKDGMRTSVQEWSETHPAIAEEEAIRRAVLLTKEFEGVSTYFVHVSTKEGIRAISQIKHDSPHVLAETTSPYLLFSIEKVKGNIPKWLPPLRNKESVEALWEMLKRGRIDTIGTDSVPMSREIKGLEKSVWEAMPNTPSIEFHLQGILTEGVVRRKIPVAMVIDLMTRRPAEIFGLFPRKGSLMPGADADVVVVDIDRQHKVRREEIRSGTPFSLFEDYVLTGWPNLVIKGGKLVIKDGNWVADPPPSQVLTGRENHLRR
jgi:dihydropyrimidinase